jgi:two-component system chemotaxis response regulator CheY
MQRYSKTDEILGSSSFKTVYAGFDHKQGVSVAWSVIDLQSGQYTDVLVSTLLLIQRFEHDHIVRIHDWFVDADSGKMHVISELFRPGNLGDFLKRVGSVDDMVLRRFGFDLLAAISYVHSLNGPPLIRNLRIENILVHQDVGIVKLDLLSVLYILTSQGYARERLEETRLMSPESLLGPIDQKADIYSFGMVLLEAATRVQPYLECASFTSLFKKLTDFRPPDALAQVENVLLRDVISRTMRKADDRPSAQELLRHSYFSFEPSLWGMHVLVIDDDPVNLKVCTRLLDKEGVTVVPCESSEDVLKLLSTRAFAGLITDIKMPGMDGFELCKTLRQLRYMSLVIIGMSGHVMNDVNARLEDSGMDAFLEKPFTFENIRTAFTRARLRRSSSTKDL